MHYTVVEKAQYFHWRYVDNKWVKRAKQGALPQGWILSGEVYGDLLITHDQLPNGEPPYVVYLVDLSENSDTPEQPTGLPDSLHMTQPITVTIGNAVYEGTMEGDLWKVQ